MVIIKNSQEIAIMRQGGKVLAKIFKKIIESVKPGVSTLKLNEIAEEEFKRYNVRPAFKGYKGYPYSLCASINDEVVHSFPSAEKILKAGDIVGLDLGAEYKNYFTDIAATIGVGKINYQAKKLIIAAKNALFEGLKQIKAGNYLGDTSSAIQKYVESRGFSIVRDLAGHGIGKSLHEEPMIPNFGKPKTGLKLKEGMTIAVEPMINVGDYKVKVLADGWTIATTDGSLSAHFEHTVAVTNNGCEILTK